MSTCINCGVIGSLLIDHEQGMNVCTQCGEAQDQIIAEDLIDQTFDINDAPYALEKEKKEEEIIEIENICSKHEFPNNVSKLACEILSDYLKESLKEHKKKYPNSEKKPNKPSKELMYSVILVAFEKTGYSRTFKEFSELAGIKEKKLTGQLKILNNLVKSTKPNNFVEVPKSLSATYVSKIVQSLGTKKKIPIEDFAKTICEKVDKGEIIRGKPSITAASCVALVIELTRTNVSIKEIASSINASENTIKSKLKTLKANQNKLYTKEKLNEIIQLLK